MTRPDPAPLSQQMTCKLGNAHNCDHPIQDGVTGCSIREKREHVWSQAFSRKWTSGDGRQETDQVSSKTVPLCGGIIQGLSNQGSCCRLGGESPRAGKHGGWNLKGFRPNVLNISFPVCDSVLMSGELSQWVWLGESRLLEVGLCFWFWSVFSACHHVNKPPSKFPTFTDGTIPTHLSPTKKDRNPLKFGAKMNLSFLSYFCQVFGHSYAKSKGWGGEAGRRRHRRRHRQTTLRNTNTGQ